MFDRWQKEFFGKERLRSNATSIGVAAAVGELCWTLRERATDKAEDVGNLFEGMVLKNT